MRLVEIKDSDPIEALMNTYFPGVSFNDLEIRRMKAFLEPILESYAKNAPYLKHLKIRVGNYQLQPSHDKEDLQGLLIYYCFECGEKGIAYPVAEIDVKEEGYLERAIKFIVKSQEDYPEGKEPPHVDYGDEYIKTRIRRFKEEKENQCTNTN